MKHFNNEQEAKDWMYEEAVKDEENIDNYRFAFQEDSATMMHYAQMRADGCCGFFDEEIIVNNQQATIGCNFGH